MSEFLEEIERVSSDGLLVTSDGAVTWQEMIGLAKKAARYCTDNGERHAALLGNTRHSAAFVMGALRAGTDVCSLHLPHRGQDLASYARDILETMQHLETDTLLVPESMAPLFDGSGIKVKPIESTCDGRTQDSIKEGGRLVQFTSGSTSTPNPVPLSLDKIAANVEAIMHRIGIGENWAASSWLPLSHDMGLCGMLMCSWRENAHFTLRDPSEFMSDPMVWLRDISNTGSMVTAAPNFALPLVLKALSRSRERIDLSTIRCLILGGETNRPDDLLKFHQSLEGYGLKRTALCPAYGMAEAVLAVSIDSPETEPRVAMLARENLEKPETIDPESIQYRSLFEQRERDELCILGAGDLLEGYTAQTDESSTLQIDGPSVFDGYLAKDRRSGMHQTRDIGFVLQKSRFSTRESRRGDCRQREKPVSCRSRGCSVGSCTTWPCSCSARRCRRVGSCSGDSQRHRPQRTSTGAEAPSDKRRGGGAIKDNGRGGWISA